MLSNARYVGCLFFIGIVGNLGAAVVCFVGSPDFVWLRLASFGFPLALSGFPWLSLAFPGFTRLCPAVSQLDTRSCRHGYFVSLRKLTFAVILQGRIFIHVRQTLQRAYPRL